MTQILKQYIYNDIENVVIQTTVYESDIEEFEKNHKVIYAPECATSFILKKEFHTLLLETMDPEIAYNTMVEKYNTNNKTRTKKF